MKSCWWRAAVAGSGSRAANDPDVSPTMAMEVVEEHDLEFDQSVIIQDDETVDAAYVGRKDVC